MLVIVASLDRYLGENIATLARSAGHRVIRTNKIDRIKKELKSPGCIVVADVAWEELQAPGVLKQLVNVGRISGNEFACICPNQDEPLKKLARAARPDEVFLRYDLLLSFKEFLGKIRAEPKK